MSGESWRLVDSGPRPGAENMALDRTLFEAHARGESSPVLRIYTWRPSAVSLGRFQDLDSSVDREACQRLGIDVVTRPTGGRAILHTEEEVTFSIVVSRKRLGTTGVMDSYRTLAGGIITALRRLGLDARLVDRSSALSVPQRRADPACFSVKARCDLVVGSAKVVGSAQVERAGFVLQQNSLPLRIGLAAWRDVFRRPSEAPAAAGLWELAGAELTYAQVAAALRTGFEEEFGVELVPSQISTQEAARTAQLAQDSMAPVPSTTYRWERPGEGVRPRTA